MIYQICKCDSCQQVRTRAEELGVHPNQMCDRCGWQVRSKGGLCAECDEILEAEFGGDRNE